MRVLMLLLMPIMGFSQLDTSLHFRQIEVHSIVIKPDSTTLTWSVDTIKFKSPGGEIKFQKRVRVYPVLGEILQDSSVIGVELYAYYFATSISIDRYGTYKVSKSEMHGVGKQYQYPYYELTNGSKLTWVENAIIWDWPIINKKTKTIIFQIE